MNWSAGAGCVESVMLIVCALDHVAPRSSEVCSEITGRVVLTLDQPAPASAIAFDPRGARIATAGSDGVVRVWDASTAEELLEVRSFARDVAFGSQGWLLAATSESFVKARAWDESTGKLLRTFPVRQHLLAFSADGTRLAAAYDTFAPDDSHGRVDIWDVADGQLLESLDNPGAAGSLAFGSDGRRLAIGGLDGTLTIWDLAPQGQPTFVGARTGRPLVSAGESFQGVRDVAFSPDDRLLATATDDGLVHIIDAATGRVLLTLTRSASSGPDDGSPFERISTQELAFSPDGTRLAVLQADGTVRLLALEVDDLMRLARERIAPLLTAEECDRYAGVVRCPAT